MKHLDPSKKCENFIQIDSAGSGIFFSVFGFFIYKKKDNIDRDLKRTGSTYKYI